MSVTSSPLDASLQEVDVHPPVTGKFKSVNRNLAKPSPSLRDFPSTPNPPIASIFGAAMSEVNGERGYDEGGERSNEVGFILSRGLGRIISLSNLTFILHLHLPPPPQKQLPPPFPPPLFLERENFKIMLSPLSPNDPNDPPFNSLDQNIQDFTPPLTLHPFPSSFPFLKPARAKWYDVEKGWNYG